MPSALIVEDHTDQAEIAARMVQFRGFTPILAETGSRASKWFATRSPI